MLIDGSSLIFRAFFALHNLTNADGVMTNGVYGFLTMYFRAVEEYKPDYILVAFDKKTKTFRHKEFEDYKANRDKAPNELNYQFGILKDILDSLNVKYLDIDGYEADDIVGTFSTIAKEEGLETVIITGDKDYFQLVNDKVVVFLTRKGISQMEEITVKSIENDYGLSEADSTLKYILNKYDNLFLTNHTESQKLYILSLTLEIMMSTCKSAVLEDSILSIEEMKPVLFAIIRKIFDRTGDNK